MSVDTLLGYYQNSKINPVAIETHGKKWIRHKQCRINLYENHLKIPISWFNDRQILEFGPNGGENSIILAMQGAKIKLVEPHQMMHQKIVKLFNDKSLDDQLIGIESELLENYQDKSQYDLVIAEGFLNALPNRIETVRQLCGYSTNLVIFNYIEKPGYFFDSLKRCLFRRLIDISEINESNSDHIIKLAQKVFLNSFNKLRSARSFDSWVKDILLNPSVTSKSCDTFDQFISFFNQSGFDYYSSSPSWDHRNTHKWYKNTSAITLKEEYSKNIPFFISGNKNEKITSGCIQLIYSMIDLFSDYTSGNKEFSNIQTVKKLNPSDWQHANEVNNLLDLITGSNYEEIINFYLQSKLSDLWGMPNHYVCLKRIVNE